MAALAVHGARARPRARVLTPLSWRRHQRSTGADSAPGGATAKSSQSPGTPLRWCSPLASKATSDPTTRSFTVLDTRISPGPGERADARADHHRQPAQTVPHPLDLARVDPDPDVETDRPDGVDDRCRAADGSRRPVEGHEEAVPRGVDLPPAEPLELAPDHGIEAREQVGPAPVAQLRRALRGPDDVDEHDGREDAVHLAAIAHPGQELLDLLDRAVVARSTASGPRPGARRTSPRAHARR